MTIALDSGTLSAPELQAVASMWKRERRVLSTSFGGTSMLPAIAPGQPVTVLCGQLPVAGDVMVFQYEQQIRVHRLVALSHTPGKPAWLLTWGDNNPLPDEPAEPSQVIGMLDGLRSEHTPAGRRLLVACLAWRCADRARLSRRVALAYRIRAAWLSGPWVFVSKFVKALRRGRSPC